MKSSFLVFPLLAALLLGTTGCSSTSTLVSTLNSVEVTAEAVVPFLAVSGVIPAALVPIIEHYLSLVSSATAQASVELATQDSAAQKALKIEGFFANVVLPQISGIPQNVLLALQAVNSAVQSFLAQIAATKTASVSREIALHPSVATFTFADKHKLSGIHSSAVNLHKAVTAPITANIAAK